MRLTDEELLEEARLARKMAYTPYSHFRVGAALLGKNGKIYRGCNIENTAYTPTICAERTAVFKAVSEGVREFDAIAVVGGPEGGGLCGTTPCGVCRQVLSEFAPPELRVILQDDDGKIRRLTLGDLLPFAFRPDVLPGIGGEPESRPEG